MGSWSLCPRCEVFVPGGRKCTGCGQALPRPALVAPETGPRFGRASFEVRCETCGDESTPVLRPDIAAVECASCGASVALASEGIARLLRFAHDAVDLRPNDRGQGRRDFGIRLDIRRGHPCCAACERPMEVVASEGVSSPLTLACGGCGEQRAAWSAERASAAYPALLGVMPATPRKRDHAGLVFALARSAVGAARVTALVCPSCAAGLPEPDATTGFATCRYCKTVSHVQVSPVAQAEAESNEIWLAFDGRGPSAQRKASRPDPKRASAGSRSAREPARSPAADAPSLESPRETEPRANGIPPVVVVIAACVVFAVIVLALASK